MYDLDETLRARRSVRGFVKDREVPAETLREALELAQLAPSNCNVQPWKVFVTRGGATERLRAALTAAVDEGVVLEPEGPIDVFEGAYRVLQIACAVELYNAMGVARGDAAGRAMGFRRNYEFFDAPHVAIVCMERHFGVGVAVDVGTWLQNFLLALWARGVASCPQASLRNYGPILHRELGIRDDLRVLCGVSFGYEDPTVPANATRQPRNPLEKNVTLLDV